MHKKEDENNLTQRNFSVVFIFMHGEILSVIVHDDLLMVHFVMKLTQMQLLMSHLLTLSPRIGHKHLFFYFILSALQIT